jgi:hypothetical protein
MSGCEESTSSLIDQRFVFGPYDAAFIVVFESVTLWDTEPTDTRKSANRLLPVDPSIPEYQEKIEPAIARSMNDPRVTVYKLPAGHVAIVRVSEVSGQGFLFEVEQLPPAARAVASYRDLGKCTGSCPPGKIPCPVGTLPDCSTGKLKCVLPT